MLGRTGIRQPEFWCSSKEDLSSVGCCKDKILTQNQLVLLLCFIRLAVSCPGSYIGRPCCGYGSSCLDRYVIGHFPDPKVGVKTLFVMLFHGHTDEKVWGTVCLSLCALYIKVRGAWMMRGLAPRHLHTGTRTYRDHAQESSDETSMRPRMGQVEEF